MSTSPTVVEDEVAGLKFSLPTYEGPLDLLLELIRKHEVDIFDIPVAKITEEFLHYIEAMEFLDLGLGGEWLEIAAMLVYIKSKMLLPKPPVDDPDGVPTRAKSSSPGCSSTRSTKRRQAPSTNVRNSLATSSCMLRAPTAFWIA